MGIADKIRFSRVRAGKSAERVAAELAINEAWYRDLESSDDELAATVTMFQAMRLASILGVRLQELVADAVPAGEKIALMDLPQMIEAHVAREGISIEAFEQELGWELEGFMESPVKMAAELPLIFLQDLSAALGIDWLSLVPEEDTN